MALLAQESIANASGTIKAGGDVDLTALTGDVLNVTKLAEQRHDGSDVRDVRIGRGSIEAGGDLTVTAGQDIVSIGAGMAAGGTADLAAGRDVVLQSNELRHDERAVAGRDGYIIDNLTHDGSSLSAGQDVVIAAGRDVAVSGSTVSAGGDADITAARDVAITAVVDQLYSQSWSKKKNSSHEGTASSQTNRGSTIKAGGDVDIRAQDDLTIQASRAEAGGAIALEATEGEVALLSGTDSFFRQEKHSRKSMVWQSMQDKGESGTNVVMTELEAGGGLTVTAGSGVVADYRDKGGLQTSLASLAQDPKTAWVAEIAQRDDVKWQAVREQYDRWNYKSQGLTGPAAAVIAIAVAVATQGYGAQFAGALAAKGTIGYAMAQAGFAAMVSQASISLINNQGNLGKVLQELGSEATLRNLAVAMAAAGLTQGLVGELGIDARPTADFGNRLANQTVQAGVGVAVNTTIGGVDFETALKNAGLSVATSMASQTVFKEIGDLATDLKIDDGDIRKVIAHAVAGCAVGQITQNCVAGAIGAGLQEITAGTIQEITDNPALQAQLAGLSAAVVTVVAGGDASAVYAANGIAQDAANGIAQDAATYNRQLHTKELQAIRDKAKALADADGDGQLSPEEAAKAGEWETRLTSEALRTVDADWNKKLAADGEAAQVLRDLAAANPSFDVTEGGRAVAFLQRDTFYENRSLYSQYIKNGADLYDKALKEWAGTGLAEVVRPSTLALVYATSARGLEDKFYSADPSLSAAENAVREMQLLLQIQGDLSRAKASLDAAGQKIQTALQDKSISAEQFMALTGTQDKISKQQSAFNEAETHLTFSLSPYRLSGAADGAESAVKETIAGIASLGSDIINAPSSPEARQALLDRLEGIAAAAQNPELIVEYYDQQLAEAARLEGLGAFDQAAAIRTQAAVDLVSLGFGAAGIVRSGTTLTIKLAGKAGDLLAAGKTAETVAQKLENLYGSTIKGPDLSHTTGRQNGVLGEKLGLQTLEEQSGLKFSSLQNNSGHGADGIAIDPASKTIYVAEVKSSQNGVTAAAEAAGDVKVKLRDWMDMSADNFSVWRSQSPENAALVQSLQHAIKNGYEVKGIQVRVGIPAPEASGSVQIVIKPW